MLRVVLVDDEPSARRGLRRMLAEFPDIAVSGEAGDLESARQVMHEVRPDAVFLDVELTNARVLTLQRTCRPKPS